MYRCCKLLFLITCICLLLTSCTPAAPTFTPSETVPDVDTSEQAHHENVSTKRNTWIPSSTKAAIDQFAITKEGMIFDLTTGQGFSICSDPLCADHSSDFCDAKMLQDATCFLASPSSETGEMILYVQLDGTTVDDETMTAYTSRKLIRYHQATGKRITLLESTSIINTWTLDPLTEDIYYFTYIVNEDNEAEPYLCVVNGLTGEHRIIARAPEIVKVQYIQEDVLYCYSLSTLVYRLDLSAAEPVLERTEYYGFPLQDGYVYYTETVGTERIHVPDDMVALSEQYGVAPYADFEYGNFYRVDVTREHAEPQLIAENVLIGSAGHGHILYFHFSPQYFASVLVDKRPIFSGEERYAYLPDDPAAPSNVELTHGFSGHDSTVSVLDAETLEPMATIDLKTYRMTNLDTFSSDKGLFATFCGITPADYVMGNGTPPSFVGFIPYGKSVLTDEDIIPLTLD